MSEKREIIINVFDSKNGKREIKIKVNNFNQHDLIGVLEIIKHQIIHSPPENKAALKEYTG